MKDSSISMLPKPLRRILKFALGVLPLVGVIALAGAEPPPPAPSNDNFANATVISSTPYSNSIDNSLATTESSDPIADCGDGFALKTVWYRFTAPSTGTMVADTFNSTYDTILSVWKVGNGNKLDQVACNDDWAPPPPYTSQVTFATTAGV